MGKQSFSEAVTNLVTAMPKPGKSISSCRMADALRDVVVAHEREVEREREMYELELHALRQDRKLLDALTPEDADGDPVFVGDIVEVCGKARPVAAVDNTGGIYYLGDAGWEYALAADCKRLCPSEACEQAKDLAELAERIEYAWTHPDETGNGDVMGALVLELSELVRGIEAAALQREGVSGDGKGVD